MSLYVGFIITLDAKPLESFSPFLKYTRNPNINNPKIIIIVDEAPTKQTYIQSSEQVDKKVKSQLMA